MSNISGMGKTVQISFDKQCFTVPTNNNILLSRHRKVHTTWTLTGEKQVSSSFEINKLKVWKIKLYVLTNLWRWTSGLQYWRLVRTNNRLSLPTETKEKSIYWSKGTKGENSISSFLLSYLSYYPLFLKTCFLFLNEHL